MRGARGFGRTASSNLRAACGALVFSIGAALSGTGCAGAPAPERREAAYASGDEVLALLFEQQQAWNRGDLRGFMSAYLDSSAIRFYSGGRVIEGAAAIHRHYHARYAAEGKEMGFLVFENTEVEILAPTAAVARGRWKVRFASGESQGLFTLILRKTNAGWRIVHDHTSAADASPSAAPAGG